MKKPKKYDEINHLDLRSRFEANGYMKNCTLNPCGRVADGFAMDLIHDGTVIDTFLYSSRFEYQQDCAIVSVPPNIGEMAKSEIAERLEQIRAEIRAERISYGELIELQSLSKYIEPSDVELLEAAGIPEPANR